MQLKTNRLVLTFDRPLVMGIVNVTPDSFSDGGQWFDADTALSHAMQLAGEGADILDIGGESSRPGAIPVPEDEELRRVVPVVAKLVKQTPVPISIDTMKPAVARACIDAGAVIVNDVSGLRDPKMIEVVRDTGAAALVMHMRGTPQNMQDNPTYNDVVTEVGDYLAERLRTLTDAGISLDQIALDPGIGFGKKSVHTWELLAGLPKYQQFGRPICLGVSRKGFLGKDRQPKERIIAGLAVACHGIATGAVQMIRTHDVNIIRDAVDAISQIQAAKRG